ncbi:7768_t:CDS:2 [Ambispora leptoticha]|uniref:7768_t:CDS:1 n=1 Tax=Ambispora leptoticha TaxID=144679 RepID=A0A9N8ZQI9_9GLOM|nr:7768_t:CDS:2 [Ambispora leptoticha]
MKNFLQYRVCHFLNNRIPTGAGLRRTPLSIRAEGSYLHASDQGVLRVLTGTWPFVLCQMHGSSLRRTPLSIRAEGSYLHAVFQYAVDCHRADVS